MPANPTPAAPQNVQDGAEAGEGRCTDTSEMEAAYSAQNPGLASILTDEEFWAVINSDPLSAYWVANALQRYEREESYRAALARGVWWG